MVKDGYGWWTRKPKDNDDVKKIDTICGIQWNISNLILIHCKIENWDFQVLGNKSTGGSLFII